MSRLRARKRFGQNFLVSPKIIQRIVELVDPEPGETVVEIGPGRGALTAPLAETGVRLIAVEFDRDLIEPLREKVGRREQVTILNQDFLKFDPSEHGLTQFTLVGNLPYNLTSPVIEWACTRVSAVRKAVFMMQREVALRLCSAPGSKDWSPLAILTQLAYNAERRFDVGPEHFRPSPKVVSSVVVLTTKEESVPVVPDGFETIVRAAFRQRRKQLVNNLTPELLPDTATARALLEECGLPEKIRAEQLTMEDFFRLTRLVAAHRMGQ